MPKRRAKKRAIDAEEVSLGVPPDVKRLGLSELGLRELSPEAGGWTQVEWMDLAKNELRTLPKCVGGWTLLRELNLEHNVLASLPESAEAWASLRKLSVAHNQLEELPESVGHWTNLERLDLSRNHLRSLPQSIGEWKRLQRLSINNNYLTELPTSVGNWKDMQRLDLAKNEIRFLPDTVDQWSKMRELYLHENRLRSLPETVGKWEQLQKADFGENFLGSLPDTIGGWKELRELSLHDNGLVSLPESIGQCTNLRELCLDNNDLRSLPDSIRDLGHLQALYLHNNPRLGLPDEVLGPTWKEVAYRKATPKPPQEIIEYYFATRGAQGQALRELKLIVVGRGGAGKTSLIKRLRGERLDPQEPETHGIVIRPLELRCNGGPITARVWDFGGQHVLHAMHEFFLTARSLYLLVLGEREDMAERDATYWLQLIRSYAGSAPVVVALNKSAGRPREMDRETLERDYGPILAWVQTECNDSPAGEASIRALQEALEQAADQMEDVRRLFPQKWIAIKRWLEGMRQPYLDYAAFQKRCRVYGEKDPARQETLSAWMHDLGIALNYARDPRLHDTTVLRPDWLANGIYALLRANDSRHAMPLAPDAVLTEEILGKIYRSSEALGMLVATDYPSEKWPFLLRLMSLFQLAYPLDSEARRLLVPALLPLEPPSGSEEPRDADRTRLRYEFAVVPGPLIPRLLVRLFSLIEQERRWRRGAILRFGESRARLWATQDERWVHLTATGPASDRLELLMIIRGTLTELFSEYCNLHVVEQWEHENQWVPRATLQKMRVIPTDEVEDVGGEQ